jgi:hypothetical protein
MLIDLTNWLAILFNTETVTLLITEYHICLTKTNDVIYFLIDGEDIRSIRKIMKYNPKPANASWTRTRKLDKLGSPHTETS